MEMKKSRAVKIASVIALGLILFMAGADCFAQCAMCRAAAANLDAPSARQLNLATLLLLCPPVAIFCGLFIVAYKHRHAPAAETEMLDDNEDGQ